MTVQTPHQLRVEQFMFKANQFAGNREVPKIPTIPNEATRLLRARLILEEAIETINALGFNVESRYTGVGADGAVPVNVKSMRFSPHSKGCDMVEVADGCADISVVTIGTLSAFGIWDLPLLDEVDNNNLSKFEFPKCPGKPCPRMGLEMKPMWNGISGIEPGTYQCESCSRSAKGPYKREADGKWIKGPDWQPPDIEEVLKRQVAVVTKSQGKDYV